MFNKTKTVRIGNISIGADFPVAIQSMTNTDTADHGSTLTQCLALQSAGCDIIRLAVENEEAASIFPYLKENGVTAPLVADIHFNYKIALAAIRAGVDKIRINPGNIGSKEKVSAVAEAAKEAGIPIRIGVNGGSLHKELLKKYGSPTPEALAESAFEEAEALESVGFSDIVISIKSSRVKDMISACRIVSAGCDYPLHIGVTEAGDEYSGLVKSSIGIGSLLADGIGDTIRVSLTSDPLREVTAAKEILSSLDLYKPTLHIVSCPTCSRTGIDLIDLCAGFRKAASGIDTKGKDITVALMGCVVNGPGEAREADIGVAGGNKEALLFKRGEIISRIGEDEIIPALIKGINELIGEESERT